MTFGSLFAGIGGMDLGLERAGMSCKWQVEIDPYASRVLARHWPHVRRWRDIRTFPPMAADAVESGCEAHGSCSNGTGPGRQVELCREWTADLICGGFPCQDISYAGRGAGLAGERSGLWYEFARVVRTLRPRFVLVENVGALLTRGLDAVLGTLAADGYDAEWACVPAAAVGAPHIRDRVFIVAHAEGERFDWHASRDTRNQSSIRSAEARNRSQQWGRDPAEDPESGVGRVAHGVPNRVDRLRGLGNAVVPQVAEWIGRRIIEAANEST